METINNITNAASKAIWGENKPNNMGEEPVSGVKGDTSKGEPFDAGNMENPSSKVALEGASTPSRENPMNASAVAGAKNSENPATDSTTEGHNVTTSGSGPGNTGEALNKAGPRPLATIAKENRGDAGNLGKDEASISSKSSSGSGSSDEEDSVQTKSHGTGTGEQYVKSTGLRADGGDFDASRPGAGREADRLLEQKGVSREGLTKANSLDEGHPSDGSEKTPEKKRLSQKIKEKLHRH